MRCPVDEHLGFRVYDWISRYSHVATLVKEDLTNRGFKVNYVKLYAAEEIHKKSDSGLVIAWSIVALL